jgi:hypothetical protein
MKRRAWLFVAGVVLSACAEPPDGAPPSDLAADDSATGGDGGGDAPDLAPAGDLAVPLLPCPTHFRFVPPAGAAPQSVEVRGEWNNFQSGVRLQPDASGGLSGSIELLPGLYGYKLLVDGNWQLDPASPRRKYVGPTENSAVEVRHCGLPRLVLTHQDQARPAVGQGRYTARIAFTPSQLGGALAQASAVLRKDGVATPVAAQVASGGIDLDLTGLGDGKYTVLVTALDDAGRASPPLRLVFWIEAEPFTWSDALLYMVMTDRFRNGDPANDPPRRSGVEARADFQGGDLAGVRDAIKDGTFARLGVNTLWLSPFHKNPDGPYLADDGVHQVMGYHGYWPVAAREVDPRLGGAPALTEMVKEAHAHGIRVLADFVVNHVHAEHEYVKKHPEWFRTGCVCGPASCDWTARRLDCLFANYLPDVNWSVPEVSAQFADDAAWWIDTFDLDGLRVDAVKHVEDAGVMNLAAHIRDEFEATGLRVFLTGETAMGWNDCGLPCNAGEYGTISRYLGKGGLDGQADFVLHHAVPAR